MPKILDMSNLSNAQIEKYYFDSFIETCAIPSLEDAIDALEIEPPEPSIAIARIESVLKEMDKRIDQLKKEYML